jgi:hypothetical protein
VAVFVIDAFELIKSVSIKYIGKTRVKVGCFTVLVIYEKNNKLHIWYIAKSALAKKKSKHKKAELKLVFTHFFAHIKGVNEKNRHDITETLLKVALNTINQTNQW